MARVIRSIGHKLIPDKRFKKPAKEIAREISKEREGGKVTEIETEC